MHRLCNVLDLTIGAADVFHCRVRLDKAASYVAESANMGFLFDGELLSSGSRKSSKVPLGSPVW